MTPITPHIISALINWITENDMTPYLLVNTQIENTTVPEQFIQPDHNIILNISSSTTRNYTINNSAISFSTTFNNEPFDIYIPINAVKSVFSKETGQGMIFSPEEDYMTPSDNTDNIQTDNNNIPPKKPKLTIVKK